MATQQTPNRLRGMSTQQKPISLREMILSLPRDDMAPQEVKNKLSRILEKKTKNDENLLELLKKHYRLINKIPISVEETKNTTSNLKETPLNFAGKYKQLKKKFLEEEKKEEIPDTPKEIEQLAKEKSKLTSVDLEGLSLFIKNYGHVLKKFVPSLEKTNIEFFNLDGYIKQPPEYKSCNFFDLDNCTVITIDNQNKYFDKLNESINKISTIWFSIRDYNFLPTRSNPVGYVSPLRYPRNLSVEGGKRKPKKFSVKKKKKGKRSKSGRRRSKRSKNKN